jgi:hypothetical protein
MEHKKASKLKVSESQIIGKKHYQHSSVNFLKNNVININQDFQKNNTSFPYNIETRRIIPNFQDPNVIYQRLYDFSDDKAFSLRMIQLLPSAQAALRKDKGNLFLGYSNIIRHNSSQILRSIIFINYTIFVI